jgi:phospholipid transport system substrate-binding protein
MNENKRDMPMRLTFAATAIAGIILAAPAFADPAADRLQAYDDQVIAIMKAKLPLGARVARFESLVASYYDMPTIASLVVGPAWAGTSAADKTSAIAALTHHSAISLARNFASYGGERFTIDPNVTTRGASRVVKLTIASGSSSNVLLYQMRDSSGAWRILDVVAQGVSQLAVQRADLASIVANGGAAALAKRLAQVDAKVK